MIAAGLREIVYEANRALAETGLVMGTFGNVSQADRGAGVFVIKPSGIPYEALTPTHMVPVSLETGEVVESDFRPSSDTPTHLELYRAFSCGGIVHTHSEYATVFAQARVGVRCMGTTHADYFRGDVPVTRPLTKAEVEHDYEKNTGLVIIETLRREGLSCDEMAAVLVAHHGPFTWGKNAEAAIEHAQVLEYLARVEWRVRALATEAVRPDPFLIDKHYLRKHGPDAYYGQK
jgi:L-ribulose-5-phosphate 4-epimerase